MLREGGFGFTKNRETEIRGTSEITATELLHSVHRVDSTIRHLKGKA